MDRRMGRSHSTKGSGWLACGACPPGLWVSSDRSAYSYRRAGGSVIGLWRVGQADGQLDAVLRLTDVEPSRPVAGAARVCHHQRPAVGAVRTPWTGNETLSGAAG